MRSANPALSEKAFREGSRRAGEETMTINGTVAKTILLLLVLSAIAVWMWLQVFQGVNPMPYMIGGGIGGFIIALVTIFKKDWAPLTTPLYAVAEGLVLGALSAIMEYQYPGIVIQAVLATFGTLFAMLVAFQTGLIKVTQKFRMGVFAATGGIALVYLISMVLGFFNINVPFIHEAGLVGIGFSVFVVIVAALNLVLDFDMIEKGAEMGAPKYMEWYGAFGLLVTLVWLYIEFLRLLSKTRRR